MEGGGERGHSGRICALCERAVPKITRHHLVPRSRSRKAKRRLRGDARRAVVERQDETIPLCRPCHATVHATLSERELQLAYDTPEALRSHPEIEKFVAWVRR